MSQKILNFSRLKTQKDLQKIMLVGFLILGVLVATTLVLSPQIFRKQASENKISLKLLPSELKITPNQKYDIQIGLNSLDKNVAAVEIHLQYDPKKVVVQDLQAGDYLPVILKVSDDHEGNIHLILGAQLNSLKKGVGILGTLKIKTLTADSTEIKFTADTKIAIEGSAADALQQMDGVTLQPVGTTSKSTKDSSSQGQIIYPDNLKNEGVVFQDSDSLVQDIVDRQEVDDTSIKPGFNFRYIRQLFSSFFSPVANLNKNLEDRASDVIEGE